MSKKTVTDRQTPTNKNKTCWKILKPKRQGCQNSPERHCEVPSWICSRLYSPRWLQTSHDVSSRGSTRLVHSETLQLQRGWLQHHRPFKWKKNIQKQCDTSHILFQKHKCREIWDRHWNFHIIRFSDIFNFIWGIWTIFRRFPNSQTTPQSSNPIEPTLQAPPEGSSFQ